MKKAKDDDGCSISKLKKLKRHNELVDASIRKRAWELDTKEQEVKRLSSDLERRSRLFREQVAEAGNLNKMVVDCNEELPLIKNELFATAREVEIRESQLRQVTDELNRRYSEARGVEGEIYRKREEMGLIHGQIEGETYRKRQELGLVLEQVQGKKKELGLVLDQIKESDEQLESRQTLLTIRSSELASEEKELGCVRESVKLCKSDLHLKEKKVQSLNNCMTVCVQEIDSKTKELGGIQKMIELRTSELDLTKQLIRELSQELATKEKRHTEIVETIRTSSSEMEAKAKAIEVAEAKASGLYERSQRLMKDVEDKEKEVGLLTNQKESEEKKLIQLKRETEEETDGKKLILSKIEESRKQLVYVDKQLESQQRRLEILSGEIGSKENEVGETRKRLKSDIEVKEKRFQELKNLIKIYNVQIELKSKELGHVQKLIEEGRNRLCDIKNQQLSILSEAEPVALMHHETSAYLGRDEVSSALRVSPNPAEFVLEIVRDGWGLEVDSLRENMVVLFDELAKLGLPNKPQLQVKAREVAILWKGKIRIEAPKSSLEALAFLLFIVAYGLQKLINQEETVRLAYSIAQYEQAPTLFNSLGLNLTFITDLVKELIMKRHFIPAVRFICFYKLTSFSPSKLLKGEISKLRQSALGNRSSQGVTKDKDCGRLRAILELVADYNLQVDLPGDHVARLIVEREKSTPLVHCPVMQQVNSYNSVSGQRSNVNLRHVPKPDESKNLKRRRF